MLKLYSRIKDTLFNKKQLKRCNFFLPSDPDTRRSGSGFAKLPGSAALLYRLTGLLWARHATAKVKVSITVPPFINPLLTIRIRGKRWFFKEMIRILIFFRILMRCLCLFLTVFTSKYSKFLFSLFNWIKIEVKIIGQNYTTLLAGFESFFFVFFFYETES